MNRINGVGIAIAIFALIAAYETSNAAAFSIDLTQVSVGINGGFPNVVGGGFNNVTSPFQDSVSRTLQQSTVQAAYNFVWTPDVGDFSINSAISCQGPISQSSFGCGSSGKITLTTTTDVILRSDIGLIWHLPSGDREGIIDFDVVTTAIPNVSLLDRACGAGTSGGGPPNGSCGFLDETLLPAGGQYRVQYTISFRNYSGSPTVLSAGSSNITLHLEPAVPEPASLGLLVLGAMLILCRF